MDNYNKVKEYVESKKCTLLTTFEDFEIKRENVLNKSYSYIRIEFIGVCGHNSSAIFTNFKSRATGIRCKECVKKDTSAVLKRNDKLLTHNIEANSINLINKYLSEYYEIVRTNEGCRADLAIENIFVIQIQ
jgi:hypothetical protein